jgi:hypothetical protein
MQPSRDRANTSKSLKKSASKKSLGNKKSVISPFDLGDGKEK